VLSVTNPNGLGGSNGGAISIGNTSTLSVNLGGAALANNNALNFTVTAALVDAAASGNTDTINNPINFTSGATPTITSTNAGATFAFTNSIVNNNATVTFNGAGILMYLEL